MESIYFPTYVLACNKTSLKKEVRSCNIFQFIKWFNKYGKFPAKLSEEIPWKKLCVFIKGPYAICSKGGNK